MAKKIKTPVQLGKIKVFEPAGLLKSLGENLPSAAKCVTAAGDIMRKHLPAIPWNTKTLWVLAMEQTARAYVSREILKQEAQRAGLACDWDTPEYTPRVQNEILRDSVEHPEISEEIRFNRRLVEIQARETLAPVRDLGGVLFLETYLRTGALAIGENGETLTAPERLADYCILYAETPAQIMFVQQLEQMRKAADTLQGSYLAALAHLPAQTRASMSKYAAFYMPKFGFICEGIKLVEENATARALISFYGLDKIADAAPKFYNTNGVWAYTLEEMAEALGCKLQTLAAFGGCTQRTRYPEKYKYCSNAGGVSVDARHLAEFKPFPAEKLTIFAV